jgi:hypothetical protein
MRDFHQEAADGGLFLLQEGAMGTKTRTHFTFGVDTWTLTAKALSSTSPGVEDYWLHSPPTARRVNAGPARPSPCGTARVIEDSRRLRTAKA